LSKISIALFNTYPHGGAGTAAMRLTEALVSVGHDARLLTRTGVAEKLLQPIDNQWITKIPFLAERLEFLIYERDKSVRFSFSTGSFGNDLREHAVVQKADVLHFHWTNQGFLSLENMAELAFLDKPIIWTLHDMWAFTGGCHYSQNCLNYQTGCGNCPYLKRPSERDLSFRIMENKLSLFNKNIKYVTPSRWLERIARTSLLLADADICTIPNPIDTDFWTPLSTEIRLAERQKLGIHPDENVLLFVAMNIKETRKGFDYLKKSLEILRLQQPDFQVVILVLGKADPVVLATLPFPTRSLGLVREASELRKFYGLADLFIIPSLEDNLPNTVMESLACGTPVAGFDTGGIPEMVDHKINGFIAPQRDSIILAEGIFEVLSNKNRLIKMRESARKKVLENYSYEIVARQYEQLYSKSRFGRTT
jgi:glycosyltransferase involved in cell wall biosynthesis